MPYDYRTFQDGCTSNRATIRHDHNWSQLGDIRIEGIYTGFFADLSAGVTFGLEIADGQLHGQRRRIIVDRDTQIGTGSTDVLLGGFYRGNLIPDEKWDWFAQLQLDVPMLIQARISSGRRTRYGGGN